MASYKTLFQEKKNQNWLKASVAVDITRKGLIPFVTTVVTILNQAIRANVERTNSLLPGATCNSCTTSNVLPCRTRGVCGGFRSLPCKFHQHANFRNCPAKICNDFMLGIEGHHRFNGPSWKNTNATNWCSNSWEVAKCFLPPDGYLNVQTADDTDINGIINLIINCTVFGNYFTDDLSQPHNICTKVRDVGKRLRHSPQLMMSDADLSECIDTLKNLLQDNKYLASESAAKDALTKMTLLENDKLRVSTDDLANVLSHAVSTISETLKTEKNILQQHIQTLADEAVQSIAQARKEDNLELYSLKSTALKHDLQKHYLERCTSLDLGPMFDLNTPNLVEVYMPPKLSKSTVFKDSSDSSIGVNRNIVLTEIKELDEVFRNTGEQAKHIYITAKAGVGKSTFCKFIVRLWCALKTNNTEEIESLKSRGAGTYLNMCEELKNVQYVFYARLIQSRSRLCEMDDIVFHQVVKRLSKSEDYDMKFLQEILDKERCLMIFDGLDEWSHPDVKTTLCFEEDTESPHAKSREKCTVMMTSRHWRLGLQKMHSKKSNICVEIDEMNKTNIRSLVKQAFTLLVGDSDISRTIDEFFEMIDQKGLHHLLGSTLVALQLLSLWYEGHSLGDTKCHIYCNVLEMMFANALKRNPHVEQYVAEDHHLPDTIKCLQTRRHCLRFQEYILNLGKMAFESLFNVKTLEAQIEDNLSQSTRKTEELGLLTGLISKTQLHSSTLNPRHEYSFLHKTYQEMLACVYIASVPYNSEEHERLVKTIKCSCQTLSFDMMLFLCGMHGTYAKDMFEIYCDLQTAMLCQISGIEYSSVILFHENCLSIIEEMKANNIACEPGIKMRSLVLDRTYDYSNTLFTDDCGYISFLALEINEIENIDMFFRVQAIADFCETKLNFLYIENSCDMEYLIPCLIAPNTINSCINLHTLALRNLSISEELDLTGCSNLSSLELSLSREGDPVRLIISPNRLTKCIINEENLICSPVVSIKCKCPFNSGLLQQLVLLNVKIEDDLRLDCGQLHKLWLVNVDTSNITTSIDYSKIEMCGLGGFTDITVMEDALQSLQHSKCLKRISIASFDDTLSTRLNETLLSLENVEEILFLFSESPLMDLQIPLSVKGLGLYSIVISADCLMNLINSVKARDAGVHFSLKKCYVSPSDEVTIETIVGDIQQCNQCILNEDAMEECSLVGQINVYQLDFKIMGDIKNE